MQTSLGLGVVGAGRNNDDALFDDQIDKFMSKYPDYLGTIGRDGIKYILAKIPQLAEKRLSFIINTTEGNGRHWDAVYIDGRPNGSHSVEFFDSFARPTSEAMKRDLKLVGEMLKPDAHLKFKDNKIIHQHDETSTCGYHAIRFLVDRYRGIPFDEATGFNRHIKDQSDKYENDIELRKQYGEFQYL